MTPHRINGSAPAVKAKGKGRRPRKFDVLEVITTLEAYSKEAAEKFVAGVCPKNRTFVVRDHKP